MISENSLKQLNKLLLRKRNRLSENNREVKSLQAQREKVGKEVSKLASEIDKMRRKVDEADEVIKEATVKILGMRDRHNWIEKEERFFGAPGSNYDFSGKDLSQLASDASALAKDQVCMYLL